MPSKQAPSKNVTGATFMDLVLPSPREGFLSYKHSSARTRILSSMFLHSLQAFYVLD